jgi:muconate cycloisomerase
MMTIREIQLYILRIALRPAFRMVSALGKHDESRYVLVRLRTHEGIEGAGEATVTPRWSGETAVTACHILAEVLAPAVAGCRVDDPARLHQQMDAACKGNWFAKAALEMACYDAWGKTVGRPVYQLLGGPVRQLDLPSRFSIGAYDEQTVRRRTRELCHEGFKTLKVKVGTSLEADVQRVKAVREEAGPYRQLVIDANGGWDASTAIEAITRMKPFGISLVEQPVPENDYRGMAHVRQVCGIPVMADESCFDYAQACELIAQGCCDVLSIYPGKNGGIWKSARIAQLAAQHHIPCTLGSNLEWDIATAAMGHLAVGCANIDLDRFPGDIHGPAYHEDRIAKNPLLILGPVTRLNPGPGLAIEVDWSRVERQAEEVRCVRV